MASATETQSSATNSSALRFGAQISGLPHSAPCRQRFAKPSGTDIRFRVELSAESAELDAN
jgi:hypothetical protein